MYQWTVNDIGVHIRICRNRFFTLEVKEEKSLCALTLSRYSENGITNSQTVHDIPLKHLAYHLAHNEQIQTHILKPMQITLNNSGFEKTNFVNMLVSAVNLSSYLKDS